MNGFRFPEAELRQEWESDADGKVIKQRDFPGGAMLFSLFMNPKKYNNIPSPALLIFANPHSQGAWVESSIDASVRAAANDYSAALAALTDRQQKAVQDSTSGPRNHAAQRESLHISIEHGRRFARDARLSWAPKLATHLFATSK